MAEVLGDPEFGKQGPQRRAYQDISFWNELVGYHVPLNRFHRLVYTNALLLPVKRRETFEAVANSFCRLLRNWPKAVFLPRSLATDLSVPFGLDSGIEKYLNQLALVGNNESNVVDVVGCPRMSELPTPFRLPMFPAEHHRAADTRFFAVAGSCPPRGQLDSSMIRGCSHCPVGFRVSRTGSPSRTCGWRPPWRCHT